MCDCFASDSAALLQGGGEKALCRVDSLTEGHSEGLSTN